MKYFFKIVETYSKSIEVEAESEDKAFEKARKSYTADDFDEWEVYPE